MKEVWVGLLEVTQIPGDQLISIESGAAFTWFTCWADSSESFRAKAVEVMLYYGLNVIEVDEVSAAFDRTDISENLRQQVEETKHLELMPCTEYFTGIRLDLCESEKDHIPRARAVFLQVWWRYNADSLRE